MIRTPGNFEPVHPRRKSRGHKKREPILTVKVVTIPNGSTWKCSQCGRSIPQSVQCVKRGSQVYCQECIAGQR